MHDVAKPKSIPAGSILAVVILCSLAVTIGCNGETKPGTTRLHGKVTINGQPPPAGAIGSISFRNTESGQADSTSAEIVDGEYDCPNVPLGKVTVFIQLVQPTGKTISDGGRQYPELRNFVPSKFDAGIPLEVSEDNPNQDFELAANGNANN